MNWYPCNYRGGGIDNTQAVNVEGKYSLDAVQNNPTVSGSLRQEINNTQKNVSKLSKMIEASGELSGDADWNNYIESGVYKVDGAAMTAAYHAPVGIFKYGILVVIVSEIAGENRKTQIYYPNIMNLSDNTQCMVVRRIYNGNAWTPWFVTYGTLLS